MLSHLYLVVCGLVKAAAHFHLLRDILSDMRRILLVDDYACWTMGYDSLGVACKLYVTRWQYTGILAQNPHVFNHIEVSRLKGANC
jgi:hypothetical protein